jgi:hypothetical protein
MKLDRVQRPLAVLLLLTVAARLIYRSVWGIRFSVDPLSYYIQYLDVPLLRADLLRSLYYLRDQPPGFNLFLGIVLKLFPEHYGQAFGLIYFGCGLALTATTYLLMVRLGVAARWAALVTGIFMCSPITMLYENWLFYTYPLAALISTSALFLHRYLTGRRFADAFLFCALIGTIVLSRGIFHPLWMLLLFAVLVALERGHRRTVLWAALLPSLLVAAMAIKNYAVFGTWITGRALQQWTLAAMSSQRLPQSLRDRLIAEKKLTPAANIPYIAGVSAFRGIIPPWKPTGITLLDRERKVGGWVNLNHAAYVDISKLYEHDAHYALRHYPETFVTAVGENIERYVLPSDQSDPFTARRNVNARALDHVNRLYNFVFAGQLVPRGQAWLHWLGMPLLLLFAGALVGRGLRHGRLLAGAASQGLSKKARQPSSQVTVAPKTADRAASDAGERAGALTILYCLYCMVTVSAVTILFSYGDHNRYRYKVSAFYCVFLALFGQWALRRPRLRNALGRLGLPLAPSVNDT